MFTVTLIAPVRELLERILLDREDLELADLKARLLEPVDPPEGGLRTGSGWLLDLSVVHGSRIAAAKPTQFPNKPSTTILRDKQ
ncbi:MAG: hypothetical protein KC495_04000 [Dehalococcoidia bacterium]|nr:hypothetical protein [Dehalococcoidia bacterium]MCB9485859.1 hypothetical protein [Thermoflexaceae bacterium]